MGTVRLAFVKGRDDWEYAHITLQIWLGSSMILIDRQNISASLLSYNINIRQEELTGQIAHGHVILNHYQTLFFIKVNDLLCKILLKGDQDSPIVLFQFARNLTCRFENFAAFEMYYLDYSSKVIAAVKKEFDKEDALRGKLEIFLAN